MQIQERNPGDGQTLSERIRVERDAEQRDRLRAALLALEGHQTQAIMATLARSRGFVQRWAYAYRDGGIEAIAERPRGGSAPKIDPEAEARFIKRFKAGPTEADGGLCTLRGKDAVRILAEEFGKQYTLSGAYALLHRNGLECLRPRPRHPKNDPEAMQQWLDSAPLFVQRVREERPDKRVEVWLQDEARFGQQGTLTSVWAERGSRPSVVKQTEYDWCYIYAAVNPVTGASSAMLAPTVNTEYMNEHLKFISKEAGADTHVVLVLDNAGWHVAKALKVPDNITLLPLPPYSPELNCVERVWGYLRSHYLSNRVFTDYEELFNAGCEAWCKLTESDLRSICHTEWVTHAVEV